MLRRWIRVLSRPQETTPSGVIWCVEHTVLTPHSNRMCGSRSDGRRRCIRTPSHSAIVYRPEMWFAGWTARPDAPSRTASPRSTCPSRAFGCSSTLNGSIASQRSIQPGLPRAGALCGHPTSSGIGRRRTVAARSSVRRWSTTPGVAIVVAYDDEGIAAGAIGNRSASVVGVSNLFTVTADEEEAWAGAVAAISARFPGMPLVGYEGDAGLLAADRAGFVSVGPLRVWLKD